ncbi:hypothetical protein JCM10212_000127 [Sporobolomyces blumeae]
MIRGGRLEPARGSSPLDLPLLCHPAALAPYAASYVPPTDVPPSDGPVHVTLALRGGPNAELVEDGMEWEEAIPDEQDVLDAVDRFRIAFSTEMQVDLPWELGASGEEATGGTVVVIDTNILISHLQLVQSFAALAASIPIPHRPTLLVPHIVLRELDGLKTSSRSTDVAGTTNRRTAVASIATLARAATNWLLAAISSSRESDEPPRVRGQRKSETLVSQHVRPSGENNDSLVLDAALYFVHHGARVVLLSNDNNLRLRAKFEGVEAHAVEPSMGTDGAKLLSKIDNLPTLAVDRPAPVAEETRPTASSPPLSRDASLHATRSPPQRRRRTSSLTAHPPASPTAARQPSRSPSAHPASPRPLPSTVARSSSMELDPSHSVPLHASSGSPLLPPPTTRSAIFQNLLTLTTHFLSLPLYKHVYTHFKCRPDGADATQRKVLDDLGDWREWDARELFRVVEAWWNEGGIEELCRAGFDKVRKEREMDEEKARADAEQRERQAVKEQEEAAKRKQEAAKRKLPTHATPSRWALPSPAPTPPKPCAPPNPSKAPADPPARRKRPPVPTTSALHQSLAYLSRTLALPPSETTSWSSVRFEILFETLSPWLVAVLSGALKGPRSVEADVDRLVESWKDELGAIGVKIS